MMSNPFNLLDPFGTDANGASPTIQPMPLAPNWGIGVGPAQFTRHTVQITYPKTAGNPSEIEAAIWDDLKNFKQWKPNPVGLTVADNKSAVFQVPGLVPGFPSIGSRDLPVQLITDDNQRKLSAVTLKGHPLVGTRIWTVKAKQAPNTQDVIVTLETKAWERTALPVGPLASIEANLLMQGMDTVGRLMQQQIWTEYFKNVAHFEVFNRGAKSNFPTTVQFETRAENLSDDQNPFRSQLPLSLGGSQPDPTPPIEEPCP